MNRLKKIIAVLAIVSMVGVVFPVQVQAVTAEELQVQIDALLASLATLQAQLATLTGAPAAGVPAACAGITFTINLAEGSSGNDVKCLQALLNTDAVTQVAATGVGSLGAETIYFGPLTYAAVVKFQVKYAAEILTPLGLTAGTGFVGPSTRAQLNAMLVEVEVPEEEEAVEEEEEEEEAVVPTEGILTAEKNPTPADGVKVYEGETNLAVLGILLKAKLSDITVQRITLNFGTTRVYDYLSYLSLYDGDNAVVGTDLNSTTVYKSGSNYYLQLAGFSVKVPKDGSKVLTAKVNAKSAISRDLTLPATIAATVGISGVRGVDTAGVLQYGPSEAFTRTFSVHSTLAASAALSIATSADSPLSRNVAAGTLGYVYEVEVLKFSVKAEYDTIKITDIMNLVITAGGPAVAGTAYLYDGDTVIDTAAITGTDADFDDIAVTVAKDATKTLTVKVDYSAVTTTESTSTVTVSSGANIVAENSAGAVLGTGAKTGSAVSYTAYLYSVAPTLALTSATITKTAASAVASSSADAVIKFTMTAEGGNVTVTSTGAVAHGYTTTTYAAATTTGVAVDYTVEGAGIPAVGVYTIAKGTTATITVNVKVSCGQLDSSYENAFGYVTLTGVTWNGDKTTDWVVDIYKTGKVYLP